jgi:hypothetical protein
VTKPWTFFSLPSSLVQFLGDDGDVLDREAALAEFLHGLHRRVHGRVEADDGAFRTHETFLREG